MKNKQYAELYRKELLNSIIPFWEKYSPDPEYGGYFHCFDEDGTVINPDKNMWPQTREIWTFSRLYNNHEKRQSWLDMAKAGVDFLKKNGRNEEGDWYFCLTREGQPLVQPYNIFSDFFAVIGFAEYAVAAGDEEAMNIALATYDRIQQRRDNPKGKYNKMVSGARPMKSLAFPMINLNVLNILKRLAPHPEYDEIIEQDLHQVMDQFIDTQARVIHENCIADGGFDHETYEGRFINPGHGIEAMWFIMDLAEERGDRDLIDRCCTAVKWNLEFGWDRDFGGIFYFLDKLGKPHSELQWDMKLWWPHLEALIATLKGYRLTGDTELWNWFEKIHDYTWSRFPDPNGLEWFGYLSREGTVNNRCKGNRWKVCFHIPRALQIITDIFSGLSDLLARQEKCGSP